MTTSKTLIGVAVASTFGWAAAVHAGPGHPASSTADQEHHASMMMNEVHSGRSATTDWMAFTGDLPASPLTSEDSTGSTAASAGGTAGGSFPSAVMDTAPRFDSAGNEVSGLDRASDGIYSEYYLVSLNPATASEWESYVIAMEPQSNTVVLLDDGASDKVVVLEDRAYMASTYDVILLPSDFVEFAPGSRTRIE